MYHKNTSELGNESTLSSLTSNLLSLFVDMAAAAVEATSGNLPAMNAVRASPPRALRSAPAAPTASAACPDCLGSREDSHPARRSARSIPARGPASRCAYTHRCILRLPSPPQDIRKLITNVANPRGIPTIAFIVRSWCSMPLSLSPSEPPMLTRRL